jgi:glycoside/pentoside/hexuronide:cation symporter, GPH family
MNRSANPNPESLSVMLKASWGIGGLGTTSMLYLINMFVVFFLVRHLGIPAAIAGMLLAVTRLYDAIINPFVGSLSDRTTGRWGRRRPWMLAGTVLAPLGCIAVFNPPALEPGPLLYTAVFAALALYCTAYSLFAIPYTALGAEMTDDYRERASVMVWRTFWVYMSGIVITAGAPALIAKLGGDRAAYSTMSFAAATVIGLTMLWVVLFTGKARVTKRSSETVPALVSLRTALSNKPFLIILLTKMMGQLGTAFMGAAMLFFMADVLRRGENALALLGLVSNVVGIASVPLWGRLLRHVERRPILIAQLSLSALTYLSWLAATPEEPQALFVLRAFMLGALGSGSVLVAMAMVADAIEFDRLKTGQRREGMFVGAFELMQTTSFVVAPLIAGLAFSAAGLISGKPAPGTQPQSALDMIRLAMSVLPAICSASGVALLLRYRLDAGTLAALRDSGDSQRLPTSPPVMNTSASRDVVAESSSTGI